MKRVGTGKLYRESSVGQTQSCEELSGNGPKMASERCTDPQDFVGIRQVCG